MSPVHTLSPSTSLISGAEPEFRLGPAEFERVRKLIHQRAGISLSDGKQAMVYSRLARRLRELGLASFTSYLDLLEQASQVSEGPVATEWQNFINSLTTNLTSFFREEHHFTALAEDLRARGSRPLRIWCSAASTGEEPYSLAMVAVETLGPSAQVRLLCSDIDTQVLQRAACGIYEADARGLSKERQHRHFMRGTGTNDGRIRIKPELARLIDFSVFNLMSTSWSALGACFDLVFCRNVMIYFDAGTQRQVLKRIHGQMNPGGLLYVGHSENFTDATDLFRLRGKTIYERL